MHAQRPLPAGARVALAALVALITGLVYAGALWNGYVYDDVSLIQANPNVATVGRALGAFFEPLWAFVDPGQEQQTGYWRPLTLVVLAAGRTLSAGAAWGPHLVSLVLHVLATLAAARLARRLVGDDLVAWLAALLFALHPVHVQSVAWASAVNDPLFALFALLALDAFAAWRERGSRGAPLAATVWFLFALLAKEQALIVLPLALALDLGLYWTRTDDAGEQARESSPALAWGVLAAAAVLYVVARMVVYGSPTAGLGGGQARFGLDATRALSLRVELFGGFLGLLAWPAELPFFRGVAPEVPAGDGRVWTAAGWSLLWLALVGWSAWRRRWTVLVLAALMVLPQVFVVLRYESAGAYPLQDRYLYLSVLGLTALVASWALRALPRPAGGALVLALAALSGWRTLERVRIYEDDESFFRAAVAESPDVSQTHLGLGRTLLERYRVGGEKRDLDRALLAYLEALVLGHDYGERAPRLGPEAPVEERLRELQGVIHGTQSAPRPDPTVMVSVDDRLEANLGQAWCLLFAGQLPPEFDLDSPLLIFEQVTRAFPQESRAFVGLGVAHMERDEHEAAQAAFGKALELNRANVEAWSNMGRNLGAMGNFDGARGAFQEAIELRPDRLELRRQLVEAALDGGRLDVAERELEAFQGALGPGPEVDYLRGMLAARNGDFNAALGAFDRTLAAEPLMGLAHLQRGKVLAMLERPDDAVAALGQACTLLPDSFEAHYHVARLLLATPGSEASAQRYLERAYQLGEPGEQRMLLQEEIARRLPADADAHWEWLRFDRSRGDAVASLGWVGRTLALSDPWAGRADRAERLSALHVWGGDALMELDEIERAIGAYRQALGVHDGNFWGWYGLARGYARLQRPEAIDAAQRALETLDASGLKDPGAQAAAESELRALKAAAEKRQGSEAGPLPNLPDDQ